MQRIKSVFVYFCQVCGQKCTNLLPAEDERTPHFFLPHLLLLLLFLRLHPQGGIQANSQSTVCSQFSFGHGNFSFTVGALLSDWNVLTVLDGEEMETLVRWEEGCYRSQKRKKSLTQRRRDIQVIAVLNSTSCVITKFIHV